LLRLFLPITSTQARAMSEDVIAEWPQHRQSHRGKAGERLEKGWRKAGERLEKGWRKVDRGRWKSGKGAGEKRKRHMMLTLRWWRLHVVMILAWLAGLHGENNEVVGSVIKGYFFPFSAVFYFLLQSPHS
jgi:hypothetical protein